MAASNPVRRISSIIDIVASARNGITLAEIGSAAKLSPSTTHRTVNILLDVGYLDLEPSTKTYRLGIRLKRVLLLNYGTASLKELARPVLVSAAKQFSETAYVAQAGNEGIQLVDYCLPTEGSRTLVHPGFDFPPHATASGKAYYAFQSDDIIKAALAQGMKKYMPNTKTARKAVLEELACVKTKGYAISDGEMDHGVYAVAAPIKAGDDVVVGTLALVGIKERMLKKHSEKKMADYLAGAAQKISSLMRNDLLQSGE